MASNYWLGNSSSSWSTGANWSATTAPAGAEDVYLRQGVAGTVINSGLPAVGSSVDYNSYNVGPEFEGSIGDSSNIFYLGSVVTEVRINAPRAKEIWLGGGTAKTIPAVYVDGCGFGTNACKLHAGTFTSVYVNKGGQVRIGTGATVTTLYVIGGDDRATGANVVIESGATITTANLYGGNVECKAALTTVNITGGTWTHNGPTLFNVTTVNLYGGRFNFWSNGGTLGTVNVFPGATFDAAAKGATSTGRTVTNLVALGPSTLDLRAGASLVLTNGVKKHSSMVTVWGESGLDYTIA